MSARVLVVDDVPANVRLLEALLASEYFEVLTATSGTEALYVAKKVLPDIILLDVMMPDLNGFEVCQRLKADPDTFHIPVIMITALSDRDDRVRGLSVGADDFLGKPIDSVALFARVRSLVRLKTIFDELRLREQAAGHLDFLGLAPAIQEEASGGSILALLEQNSASERLTEMLATHKLTIVDDPARIQMEAETGEFALIILDLDFSACDSLRLCAQLRAAEATRQMPILALVGGSDKARLLKALELGITDYITKPVDRSELAVRVRAQIRRKIYQDRLRANFQRSVALAATDSLTGLFNRHYLNEHLSTLISSPDRNGRDLAALLIDIDHFKLINDTYGHAAGDQVLRECAIRLRRNIRDSDLAARYGGEEFIAILPNTERDMAITIAERLRRVIGEQPFQLPGSQQAIKVSCSIGLAMWRIGENQAGLFGRADAALYRAKNAGRDRVDVAA